MEIMSLFTDENVKRIIIENKSFSNTESSSTNKATRLNLQVLVEYNESDCDTYTT